MLCKSNWKNFKKVLHCAIHYKYRIALWKIRVGQIRAMICQMTVHINRYLRTLLEKITYSYNISELLILHAWCVKCLEQVNIGVSKMFCYALLVVIFASIGLRRQIREKFFHFAAIKPKHFHAQFTMPQGKRCAHFTEWKRPKNWEFNSQNTSVCSYS